MANQDYPRSSAGRAVFVECALTIEAGAHLRRLDLKHNQTAATPAPSASLPILSARESYRPFKAPGRTLPDYCLLSIRRTCEFMPRVSALFPVVMSAFKNAVNFTISTACAFAAKMTSLLCICILVARK